MEFPRMSMEDFQKESLEKFIGELLKQNMEDFLQ